MCLSFGTSEGGSWLWTVASPKDLVIFNSLWTLSKISCYLYIRTIWGTQQNFYSISHLLAQWLHHDWKVTVQSLLTTTGNCEVTMQPAVNNGDNIINVQSLCSSHCASLMTDGIGVSLCMNCNTWSIQHWFSSLPSWYWMATPGEWIIYRPRIVTFASSWMTTDCDLNLGVIVATFHKISVGLP